VPFKCNLRHYSEKNATMGAELVVERERTSAADARAKEAEARAAAAERAAAAAQSDASKAVGVGGLTVQVQCI
jgi:hypothetical protein